MCANEKKTPTAYDQFVSYVPTNIVKVSVEMTVDRVVQLVTQRHISCMCRHVCKPVVCYRLSSGRDLLPYKSPF